MDRSMWIALVVASAAALIVGVQAQDVARNQSERDPSTAEVVLLGCLTKSIDGEFLLKGARPASPAGAASGSDATGTSGTRASRPSAATPHATEPAGSGTADSDIVWRLMPRGDADRGDDLTGHVGQTVEVTGRTELPDPPPANVASAPATAPTAGGSGAAESVRSRQKIAVESVKVVSASCL